MKMLSMIFIGLLLCWSCCIMIPVPMPIQSSSFIVVVADSGGGETEDE
jgi:hypothetical protein